jgi:hypothetical protein
VDLSLISYVFVYRCGGVKTANVSTGCLKRTSYVNKECMLCPCTGIWRVVGFCVYLCALVDADSEAPKDILGQLPPTFQVCFQNSTILGPRIARSMLGYSHTEDMVPACPKL